MIDGYHFLFLITTAIQMSLVNKYMVELIMEKKQEHKAVIWSYSYISPPRDKAI